VLNFQQQILYNLQMICSLPMFPLSCACVCAHRSWAECTQENMECPEKCVSRMFLHIFHTRHSEFRWDQVKCCSNKIVCTHRL